MSTAGVRGECVVGEGQIRGAAALGRGRREVRRGREVRQVGVLGQECARLLGHETTSLLR